PDGPYETVGGFLAARLGKVPSTGDEVPLETHTLTVTQMDGRRVARVRLHLVTPPEGEQAQGEPAVPADD
ncbi:MAG TPA: transporter associated domain-containing protein, partial [Kribbella sp.]